MDLLRWILLGVGLLVVGAIWWHGRRQRAIHEESLFERAQRLDPEIDTGAPEPERESEPEWEPEPERALEPDPEPRPEPESDELQSAADPEWDTPLDIDLSVDPEDTPGGPRRVHTETRSDGKARSWSASPGRLVESARERLRQGLPRSPLPGLRKRNVVEEPPTEQEPDAHATQPERIVALYVVAGDAERLSGAALAAAFQSLDLQFGQFDIYHRLDHERDEPLFSVANVLEPGTFDPHTMPETSTPGVAFFARLPGPRSATEAFDAMAESARILAKELDARLLDADRSTLTRQTEQHLRDDLREFDLRRRPRST